MKIEVLMATKEGIVRGKRIDFGMDEKSGLYIASCEGRAFGVAKRLTGGKKSHFKRLGPSFSGVAVSVHPYIRRMEVKVKRERRKKRIMENFLL